MNNFFNKLLSVLFFVAVSIFNTNAQNPVILECVDTNPTTGTDLQWSTHDCPGVFGGYEAHEAIDPNLTFTPIANTNNTTVNIPGLTNPADPHYFYVNYICDGVTVASSDTISNQGLADVEVNKVSVVGASINIEWTPLGASNIGGYAIGIPNGVNTLSIDTIFDPNASVYSDLDLSRDPNNQAQTYTVTAIDKCDNLITVNDNFHSTVHLQVGTGDCNSLVPVNWTHYVGWDSILEYRIFINGSLVATIPSDENLYNVPVATITQTIIVEAVHPDGITTSQSNAVVIGSAAPTLPSNLKLFSATIPNGDKLYLGFEYSSHSSEVFFNFLRGTASENSLDEGNPIVIDNNFIQGAEYPEDTEAKPESFSYYYRVQAKDDCGATLESNYAKTIFLDAQDNFNQTITLEWNEFELQSADINRYELLRFDDLDYNTPTIVASFNAGEAMTYTDDVSSLVSARPDGYEYQVKAYYDIQTQTLGTLTDENSFSNRRIVIKNSQIKDVPTAFRPNGVNNQFKPVIDFANAEAYSMAIINRWGEKVFESVDPEIGWDGIVDGVLAPQGVYAYVIKMKSFNSRDLIRKGTVLLVR